MPHAPRGTKFLDLYLKKGSERHEKDFKSDKGILVPVKTDKPVLKANIFAVIEKINAVTCKTPIKLGDVIIENIDSGANLVATKSID